MKEVAILHDKESGDGIEIFSNRNGLVIFTMDDIEDNIYFARDKGKMAKGVKLLLWKLKPFQMPLITKVLEILS